MSFGAPVSSEPIWTFQPPYVNGWTKTNFELTDNAVVDFTVVVKEQNIEQVRQIALEGTELDISSSINAFQSSLSFPLGHIGATSSAL